MILKNRFRLNIMGRRKRINLGVIKKSFLRLYFEKGEDKILRDFIRDLKRSKLENELNRFRKRVK